ncbi:MAG: Spy/CpxP family protein refolding chaperone [Terracidiphilus sp.]|jgi:Spy/CpxP family protein refolding chaperone
MKGSTAVKLGMAIAGVLLAGTALAQGPGAGMSGGGREGGPGFGEHRPPMERAFGAEGDHGRWWNNPKLVAELKLSDAQRKEMDATLLAHREKLVDLRGSLEKAELELEPLMKEDQPNEGKILAQIDKVAQARAELEKANARFLLAIRGKLTPEQWKQLQADRDRRGQQRGGWGKDGQGRGGQGCGGWQQGGPGGQYHRQAPPPPLPPLPPLAAPPGAAPPAAVPQSMVDGGPDGPGAPAAGSGDVQ